MIALDLLHAGNNEVDIEIIENGRNGLFGIGRRFAIVSVTLKPTQAAEAVQEEKHKTFQLPSSDGYECSLRAEHETLQSSREEYELAGKVWVRNEHIKCKDAVNKYPLITPAVGMQLYKNGELVDKTVLICEADILEARLADEIVEPSWDIEMIEDRMMAVLTVTPGYRLLRRVKDHPPCPYIQLEVEEKQIPMLIESGSVLNRMRELGIVNGIDFTEIAQACASDEKGSFVIARGTQYTPGKNGSFKPTQQVEIIKALKERMDGSIDYRELHDFPSVSRGDVIGIVIPPVPGYPGLSVTNEPIFPPEVHQLVWLFMQEEGRSSSRAGPKLSPRMQATRN